MIASLGGCECGRLKKVTLEIKLNCIRYQLYETREPWFLKGMASAEALGGEHSGLDTQTELLMGVSAR